MLLYKYCPANMKTIEIIKSNRFWFARPETFNDPFDGFINLPKNSAFDDLTRHINSNLKNGNPYGDNEYGNNLIEDYNKIGAKKLINHIYTNTEYSKIEKSVKERGVFSVSKNPLDPLMWSHYSLSHKGICIGIKINKHELEKNFFLKKIKYSKTRPIIDINDISNEVNITKILSTKHIDWSYEKEWRLITKKRIPNNKGKLMLIPGNICEIIFGIRTANKFIQLLQETNTQNIALNRISHNYFDFELLKIPFKL